MTLLRSSIVLTLCTACGPGPVMGADAGPRADAQSAVDATVPPDAPDAATPDPIAECQLLAGRFADACTADPYEACSWRAYGDLCASGNTALLVASMRCLDSSTCTRFVDAPRQCLIDAEIRYSGPAALQVEYALCHACAPTADCAMHEAGDELIPFFAESDLANLDTDSPMCTQCWQTQYLPAMCPSLPLLAEFAACL